MTQARIRAVPRLRKSALGAASLLLPLLLLGPRIAAAQPAALDEAEQMLVSSDPEEVEAGIQMLGLDGSAAAVPLLAARVREGLPPKLLETAVTTLMAIGQPEAGPVLFELTRHRRPEVRAAAFEAIGAVEPPDAEPVLIAGLSDSHADARAAAARALGQVGSPKAIDALLEALDRGNMAAAQAVGELVPADDVDRILDYLGKLPLTTLGPAITAILTRKDVSKRARLRAVGRVQELATPEVKTYLGDLMADHASELSPAVSKAVLQAMASIAE